MREPLSGLENSIKVRRKLLDALLNEKLMARKRHAEEALRAKVKANPQLAARVGNAWSQIDEAEQAARELATPYTFLEQGAGFDSRLFDYARTLVRGAAERSKPNTERLREFTATELPRIEQELTADIPVYPQLERLTLSFSLERMREWMPDHPLIHEILGDETPDTAAAHVIGRTRGSSIRLRATCGASTSAKSRRPSARLQSALPTHASSCSG